MTNPLNNSWYSTGTNKHSILDEVATATDTRESVVQKEVETILASSECKHSVMEVMVDMSSVWMFASTKADDLTSSLREIEGSIDSIEDVIGGGDYGVDWFPRRFQKIQIVTIADILEGKQVEYPESLDVTFKKAQQSTEDLNQQFEF